MHIQISIKMTYRHEYASYTLQLIMYMYDSASIKKKRDAECMTMFRAKAEACWGFHPQITRQWLLDYISNSVSC